MDLCFIVLLYCNELIVKGLCTFKKNIHWLFICLSVSTVSTLYYKYKKLIIF